MSYYRSLGTDKSLLKVSEMVQIIDEKQAQLIELAEQKKKLDRKADFRAQSLIVLGSSVLMSQFAFIMGGTFVYLSWDVMEPLSYLMLFSNFTCAFAFYTLVKKDLELQSVKEILTNRFARRLYRKRGFNVDEMNRLTEEILEMRAVMNKSIF